MSESIHQQLLACPREVRQYVLEQAVDITQLREQLDAAGDGDTWREACQRLEAELSDRDAWHRAVMSEGCDKDEWHCTCVPPLRREIERLRAGAHSDAEVIDKLKRERDECRRLLREAVEARWSANGKLTLVRTEWFDEAAKAGGGE